MATKTTKIPDDVAAAIRSSSTTDSGLGIVMPQLDRSTYDRTAKFLKAHGGKWNRSAQATLFESPEAVDAMYHSAAAGEYIDAKRLFQQFFTPRDVADLVVCEANIIANGTDLLEPSVGGGALLHGLLRANADRLIHRLVTVEIDDKQYRANKDAIPLLDYRVAHSHVSGDFLKQDIRSLGGMFDRIVMNPPFCNQQDIDHVMHAVGFLRPGGRLVSVMSPSFTFRNNRKSVEFREFVARKGRWLELEPGAFADSGTMVRAVVVSIDL